MGDDNAGILPLRRWQDAPRLDLGATEQTANEPREANMVSQNESLPKDQANIASYRQNLVYQADALVYGDVTISFSAMEVHRGGQPVALTRKEFKTLAYLLQNARRVISRDELLNEVWGYGSYPSTRTVDNHILRLRKKLEPEPARPKHFRTVRGMGYKFLA
jgi:DNA-binding response OmpR family regulator